MCALATSAYFINVLNVPIEHRIARSLLGETWFQIDMQGDHVGFMHNRSFRGPTGHWHFESTTHFLLEAHTSSTISKTLVFQNSQAAPLVSATYTNANGGVRHTTLVAPIEQGYIATLQRDNHNTTKHLDWQYSLADFVKLETWLDSDAAVDGMEKVASTPDFEKLRITPRTYLLVRKDDQGYLIEHAAPRAANQIQLGKDFRPISLEMAGLFGFKATDEASAIALGSFRQKTNYQFAIDQRLNQHTNLAKLSLNVVSPKALNLPSPLHLYARHVTSTQSPDNFSGEELQYPITHRKIQSLVQRAGQVSNDPLELAHNLVHVAYNLLDYVEDKPAGSVHRALATQQGECTDYADLYTTLARASGLAAKTVYGLAYKDQSKPAFVFHAWNEVFVDGNWIAVDPTWDQTELDASHIPLSDAQAAELMLAFNTGGVRFELIDAVYN